eukprot:scaffold14023_cov53-Phaeocystis_antarctica.AAC.2
MRHKVRLALRARRIARRGLGGGVGAAEGEGGRARGELGRVQQVHRLVVEEEGREDGLQCDAQGEVVEHDGGDDLVARGGDVEDAQKVELVDVKGEKEHEAGEGENARQRRREGEPHHDILEDELQPEGEVDHAGVGDLRRRLEGIDRVHPLLRHREARGEVADRKLVEEAQPLDQADDDDDVAEQHVEGGRAPGVVPVGPEVRLVPCGAGGLV